MPIIPRNYALLIASGQRFCHYKLFQILPWGCEKKGKIFTKLSRSETLRFSSLDEDIAHNDLTHFGKNSGFKNVRRFPSIFDLRVAFIESIELKSEHLINNLYIVYTN